MLKIIHRINTIKELKGIPKDYGVEADIRNEGDKLILHHEPFNTGESFDEFCSEYKHAFIILNVKTEGIEKAVLSVIRKYDISNYFFLDVTFPFMLKLIDQGEKNIAVRFSEYESVQTCLKLKNRANWVWLDCFSKLPLDKKSYDLLKNANFKICLVGPEILGRPEDIERYKQFFEENQIIMDAVMTSEEYVNYW